MRETIEKLRSVHLQNERTIWVCEPGAPASVENLTIFLDGEVYRDRVGAMAVLEQLRGAVADSWFVFVSMESVEARWVECPCHPPFAKFVVEELLPWLKARFAGTRTVRQRTLVGLSYTGLAAAFVAKEYPGVFQKIISQSGSFWWENCWLVERFRECPPVPSEFYLDVGVREVQENVQHREDVLQVVSQIDGVRRFRDVLVQKGNAVRYVEFEGAHEFEAWKRTLPDALRWALPQETCASRQGLMAC